LSVTSIFFTAQTKRCLSSLKLRGGGSPVSVLRLTRAVFVDIRQSTHALNYRCICALVVGRPVSLSTCNK